MSGPSTGGALARRYHDEVVGPVLASLHPGLRYAVGRLGSGSDMLGLDDERSRDHDWGLRLTLLVDDDGLAAEISDGLEAALPESFAGHPVRFPTTWDPSPTHKVETASVPTFVSSRLGIHPGMLADPLAWLALTGQSVLEVTAGPVFHDTAGALTRCRERLDWYPDDVWRYVVAAGWQRLGQELPMVGRCGDRGDDLGSRVITARLVRDIVHLALLVERVWPPYPKWLGTRFAELPVAVSAGPHLAAALATADWRAREASLAGAAGAVHARQRESGLPTVTDPIVRFMDRPFRTVNPDLPDALTGTISDPAVAALPVGVGSIEQWVDNVDVLTRPDRRAAAASAWHHALRGLP